MVQYNSGYFNDDIFSTDYAYLADVIVATYKPSTVIEFGCGTGNLSKSLSKLNVKVEAIDGYSEPDFTGANVSFTKVDLNNEELIIKHLAGRKFDIAICTEVAEHLQPSSSAGLIKQLTCSADVVIFSAAVPNQGGHGHINCQPREFWHRFFTDAGFVLKDSLRSELRKNANLAPWYVLNTLDYVSENKEYVDQKSVVQNLLASESYSSSFYYKASTLNIKNEVYLNKTPVKQYMQLRFFLKKILKRG